MNAILYWKQQLPLLALHLLCMAGLAVFLRLTGNSVDSILLILAVWCAVLALYCGAVYHRRKIQLDRLLALAGQLEERYLLPEVMPKSTRAGDQVYHRLLKLAGKSMLEQVAAARRERSEYREYIEQWVHEIKTPVTAMRLLCENHPSALSKELLVELEKTNRCTEQVLYYARSEHTETDYSIREIRLFDVVHQAIAENKYLLLQNGVRIELQETDDTVYSDEKWLCFILNQLIVNAVQYRAAGQPVLRFAAGRQGSEVVLRVEDNGPGIPAGDLPRIFEKGFTGQNGRKTGRHATGLGLYLCKRLCGKLDLGLCAHSAGAGTTMQLSFRINDLIRQVQR